MRPRARSAPVCCYLLAFPLVLAIFLVRGSCARPLRSQPRTTRWSTGFWFWDGSWAAASSRREPLDVLFFQVGTIHDPPRRADGSPLSRFDYVRNDRLSIYANLPRQLPPAREYWAVLRFDRQGVPSAAAATLLDSKLADLWSDARAQNLTLAGVQLDIDSPTGSLARYASFLGEVRKGMPQGAQLSITALLDWFRGGTAIGDVVSQVDEFVPQFYDLTGRNTFSGGDAIAAPIDAARWAPVFNRFGKRYRIGISTFGRSRMVRAAPAGHGYEAVFFRGTAPLDFARNPAFKPEISRNEADETVLTYRAVRRIRISYTDFQRGDAMQFILSTPESVRAAVESAKKMGGPCAGVLFFRWPTENEPLGMQPDVVLAAAGLTPRRSAPSPEVHVSGGGCVAVNCMDVFLLDPNPLVSKPVRFKIHSSAELEYFLPDDKMPVRMTGPSDLELSLPPFCSRGRMYLGRAVAARPFQFTVKEEAP